MKPSHIIPFAVLSLVVVANASAQGWVAEIDIDLNHELYGYEKITSASVVFSGVSATGSSATSTLNFVISGTGPLTGDIYITVEGLASDPYSTDDIETKYISVVYFGHYTDPCLTGVFESTGQTPHEILRTQILIFPRMEITSFLQECDKLTLTTGTCSRSFFWEVSDDLYGGFKAIGGKETASITITREELASMGFTPFGRKYFRVTGRYMTTSQLQAIDIYYPGPEASFSTTSPKCNNGKDALVRIDIMSPVPSFINDFVVTLFQAGTGYLPVEQIYLQDHATADFSNLSAGAYMVRIENNSSINIYGNCWAEHSFVIDEPEPVVISSTNISDFNGFGVSCSQSTDGSIDIIPSGGTGSYDHYEWSPSISVGSHAGELSAGVYSVKVKDSNDCWSSSYKYVLTAPDTLSVELLSTGGKNGYGVSCPDSKDGKILTDVMGGVLPYSFEWSDGSNNGDRKEMPPGLFELTVSDANGCTAGASISLTSPDPISFELMELAGIECPGVSSGILEIQSVINTLGKTEYEWSSGEKVKYIENKSEGTYTATVSDEQGCSTTKTIVLKAPAAYSVEITPTTNYNGYFIRCNGESTGELKAIVLDAARNEVYAENYTWYRNDEAFLSDSRAFTATGIPAGSYRLEVTYNGQCKAEGAFVLDQPPAIEAIVTRTANYNGADISCAGARDGAIAVQVHGGTGSGYLFQWNTGQTSAQLTNLGPGNYKAVVTDGNGCNAFAETTITEPDTLKAGIQVLSNYNGLPISCHGAADARLKAVTTGGTSPLIFAWNSGQHSAEITDMASGDYHVVATDLNGCTDVASMTVRDPSPIAISIDHSDYNGYGVSCHSAADGFLFARAQGGVADYTFQWQGVQQEGALYPDASAGTYQITVHDKNGCENLATQSLTEPPTLGLSVANAENVSCHGGADGKIVLSASGGVGDYQYALAIPDWQSDPSFTGLAASNYLMRVRDRNGCQQARAHEVSEPTPVTIEFENIQAALCGEAIGGVSAIVEGGTAPYELEWATRDNEILGSGTSLARLKPGVVVLSVVDRNLCEAAASVGIPSTDGPTIRNVDVSPATCSYASDGSASLEVEGKEPFVYLWPDGQTTSMASNLSRGQYLVEITDSDNCTTVRSIEIPAPDSLKVELEESAPPSCYGKCDGRLLAKASGGSGQYTYHWTNSSGPSLENICAGEYSLRVTDDKQCATSASFVLDEPPMVEVSKVVLRSPSCAGECDGSISLDGIGGAGSLRYIWSTGQSGPHIENLCKGVYTVSVEDANACSRSHTYTVEDPEIPSLDLGGSAFLCEGQSHSLDPGPHWISYSWGGNPAFESSDRRVTISKGGTYWLSALDINGCVARDTFLLETSGELLNASFLVPSLAIVRDTIVLIDISWPVPEGVNWILPEEMKRISDLGNIVFGQFEEAGEYMVTLSATLGECKDDLTKTITILDDTIATENSGRMGQESFVKEFTIYPNPNDGRFSVGVDLLRENTISVMIWNILTSQMVARWEESGKKSYLRNIDLRPMSSGTYSIRLDYGKGIRYLRFIVE